MAFCVVSARRMTGLFGLLVALQGGLFCYSVLLLSKAQPAVPSVSTVPSLNIFAHPLGNEGQNTAPELVTASVSVNSEVPQQAAPITEAIESEPVVLLYTVKPGDTVSKVLGKAGISAEEGAQVVTALKKLGPSGLILRAGQDVELRLSPDNTLQRFTRKVGQDKEVIVSVLSTGIGFSAEEVEIPSIQEKRSATGIIKTSLAAAAAEAKVPFEIIDEFVDLFGGRVEFRRDLQPGDSFTVEYVERRCERTGELLATEGISSASLKRGDNLMAAFRHADESGKINFYDEKGNVLGGGFLRYPLKFSRISSAFSYARFHPVLQRSRPHLGVDFAAPTGTPVRTVADGIVEVAAYRGGAGNMVKIVHNDRYATAYLHLSRFAPGIKPGSRVKRGQVIGAVGATGYATGPHLHFSLYDRGKYVDPLKAKLPTYDESAKPLPKQILLAALQEMHVAHQQLALNSAGPLPQQG